MKNSSKIILFSLTLIILLTSISALSATNNTVSSITPTVSSNTINTTNHISQNDNVNNLNTNIQSKDIKQQIIKENYDNKVSKNQNNITTKEELSIIKKNKTVQLTTKTDSDNDIKQSTAQVLFNNNSKSYNNNQIITKEVVNTNYTVSNYNELYSTINNIKTNGTNQKYYITLKSGTYIFNNNIRWGNITQTTKYIKLTGINNVIFKMYNQSQVMNDYIQNYNGYTMEIENIIFTNGHMSTAGAIFNNGLLTLRKCQFINNTGLYVGTVRNTGSLNVFGCIFINNSNKGSNSSAKFLGGAITNYGSALVVSSIFTNNTVPSDVNSFDTQYLDVGGAIYNQGKLTVNSSTFNNNEAYIGGAIANTNGTLLVMKSKFNDNYAKLLGGAISCVDYMENYSSSLLPISNIIVNGCNFTANNAERGGAIYQQVESSNSLLTVISSRFINNTALPNDGGVGGAIESYYSNLNIKFSVFTNNKAEYGGAITTIDSKMNIQKCKFESNEATEYGGGLYVQGKINVFNSTFNYNKASGTNGKGGAIEALFATLNVKNSNFTSNNATKYGGAIFLTYSREAIYYSNFIKNVASEGALLYVDNDTGSFTNFVSNNVTRNYANTSYGHTFYSQDPIKIINNTITTKSIVRLFSFSKAHKISGTTIIRVNN